MINNLPDWGPLKPHPKQSQAWFTKKKFVILACGRGSGKTLLARRRTVRNLAVSHNLPLAYHGYALPTYGQARRVAWEPLKAMVPKEWITNIREGEMSIETVFNSKLLVVGLDKPQRVEGTQWSSFVVDESCDVRPKTFDLSIMPALTHHCFSCWRIGVPKRQGVGAYEFREAFERGFNDPNTFVAQWKSAEIVDAEKLIDAKRNLDPVDYAEQYEAEWQSMGGGIFHSYDDDLNVGEVAEYRPNRPIVVMSDFNVDPMCWCLGHYVDNTLLVFDEIAVRNTNTPATLDVLFNKYGDHENGWLFTGDASARARRSSADATDYIHIFNDQRFKNKRVVYSSCNPTQSTRFSSCNAAMCNALGERRVFIHPRCSVLRRDLRARSYKPGTREPNDSADIGHMSDAFGYGIMLLMPLAVDQHEAPEIVTT
jgi:hypothetical protein